MTEHWARWAGSQGGPQTDAERRVWQLCRTFKLSSLPAVVLIRVAQFTEQFAEPCWWTDTQLAKTIVDGEGRHPCIASVRRARTYLERVGLLKCERVHAMSERLGPWSTGNDFGYDPNNARDCAKVHGTTLKTIYWEAIPNTTRRSA